MAKNKKVSGKKAALIVLNVVLSLVFSVLLLLGCTALILKKSR